MYLIVIWYRFTSIIQYNIKKIITLKSSGNPSSAAHQSERVRQFLVGLTIPILNSWIGMLGSYFTLFIIDLTCCRRASRARRPTKHEICRRKSNSTAMAAYREKIRTAGMGMRAPGKHRTHTTQTGILQSAWE